MTNGVRLTPLGDDEIHAFVDRRLSPERRAEVEHLLAADPEAASRAAFYARMNAELHSRFDHVLAEPIPASWGPVSSWRRRLRDRRRPTLRHFAVAAAWLFAGIFAGWATHDLLVPPKTIERIVEVPAPLTTQAAVAHAIFTPEVRHPVEVTVDERDHLVRWLSARMKRPVKAPDLDAMGWRLMGGRLLPVSEDSSAGGHVACQFMYESGNGERVTLYMKTLDGAAHPSQFRYADEIDDIRVFYWVDPRMGYALTGKIPKEDLKKIAWNIYAQFNP